MKFLWTTIMVRDMEASLDFYQGIIGLTTSSRFQAGPEVEIVFLGEGETKVELICNKQNKDLEFGKDISMGFEVKSLDETLEMIQSKGIKIQGGPFQPNPHTKFFYVLDPNGVKIQFVEHM
ncbi:MAG: VOC family protein [Vallitaleaceae bacterium]|nr:VOC family protein [Vallitaleaceae bacterium]